MPSPHSRIGKTYLATLRAIKSFQPTKSDLTNLSRTAWWFTVSTLWNGLHFSSQEREASLQKIEAFLRAQKDPRKAFIHFCERILLARRRVQDDLAARQVLPSQWLDGRYPDGFSTTAAEYVELRRRRESLPQYQRSLKALAEAVLEFSEEPTPKNFRYWKSYFVEKEARALLEIFQVFAINFLYTW